MPQPTSGHGNPDWSKEETLLALELYQSCQGQLPSDNDPRVVQLSHLLQRLPIHPLDKRNGSFRNPDGVAFKLQNLRSVATGKGLQNVSKTDRLIWEEYGALPARVRELAEQIRATAAKATKAPAAPSSPTDAELQRTLDELRPNEDLPVYKLVEQAGVETDSWLFDQNGDPIRLGENTYKNSRWAFGGGDNPIVLCVWWRELSKQNGHIVYAGNQKDYRTKLGNDLSAPGRTQGEAIRLRGKIDKAREFEALVWQAEQRGAAVRLILLDGRRTELEVAALESSKPDVRRLDTAEWFVHQCDPFTGEFKLVREVPYVVTRQDPFDDVPDPADDPELRRVLDDGSFSDTEKDAIVKQRVGHGWFRDQLVKRWGGCAVTPCPESSVLIASHIVPWSRCRTKAERLSPANGLLLSPNLDKLFDRGLITFDENCRIVFSSKLPPGVANALNVDDQMRLRRREWADIQPFLARHREEIFQGPPAPKRGLRSVAA